MTKSKFLKNTALLFISMMITKLCGALFKIPLTNLLGGAGMGYFSAAYGLYSPVFALTAAGIPSVVMRITARFLAVNSPEKALFTRKCALILFSITGALGTFLVLFLALPFSEYVLRSPESALSVMCISPAVFICCIGGVFRGYREGMFDVKPSAAASIAEAASRAFLGIALSYSVLSYAEKAFKSGKAVFGRFAASPEEAYKAALPYAAAAAVLAVSLSELFGLLTLIMIEKRKSPKIKQMPQNMSRKDVFFELIREIIPVSAAALVTNSVSFVDLITVPRALAASIERFPEYYEKTFKSLLNSLGGALELSNFMYGSYTGIACSLFMLIPSFAGMVSSAAAPEIAFAFEKRDAELLSRKISQTVTAAAVIACPACFGAAAAAKPLLSLLYGSRPDEAKLCELPFIILCMGGVFMILSSVLFGIFQSAGRSDITLKLMAAAAAAKLVLNPVLVSVPQLNITGAAVSSVVSYIITAIGGIISLKKRFPARVSILKAAAKPFFCGILSAAAAYFLLNVLFCTLPKTLNLVFSVAAAAIFYAILLILTGVFRANDIIKALFLKKSRKST